MDNNYHIFVIITTILVYIFLSSKKKENKEGFIMYLLYTPMVLYAGYYFFYSPYIKLEKTGSNLDISTRQSIINYSDDLLSDPYPVSSNSKF